MRQKGGSRKLLLPMNTSFADAANGRVITTIGTAPTIDTTDPKFGVGCGLFVGTGGLTGGSSPDLSPGTGSFTVQAWVKQASIQSGDISLFICHRGGVSGGGTVSLGLQNGKLYCGPSDVAYGPVSPTAIATGAWVHVAACKDATTNTMRVFQAGALMASAADSYNYSQGTLYVGQGPTGLARYSGRLDDLAYDNVALYTAAFTPPTGPLSP
jgi:hypothetical protein